MELPYRVFKHKLAEHPLVKKVCSNYYNISVLWSSGIRERYLISRIERRGKFSFKTSVPTIAIPPSTWWEDLSNNKQLVKTYKFGINEFEHDVAKYPNFTRWSWAEYNKLGFYEQRIFLHEFFQFVLDNGWVDNKYNDQILNNSLQLIYDESPRSFSYGRGLKLFKTYKSKEKPGIRLIDNFFPLYRYGKGSSSAIFNKNSIFGRRTIYRAIVNIAKSNALAVKNGNKIKYPYFDYESLLLNIRATKRTLKMAKTRPINLYRSIIKHFGMSGKSMYDFEPHFGEKCIAATVEECFYAYRPTCPFDMQADGLAKFFNTNFKKDSGTGTERYDFAIIDFNFAFNIELFNIVLKDVYQRVDSMIVFVDNKHKKEVLSKVKVVQSIPIRTGMTEDLNGEFIMI